MSAPKHTPEPNHYPDEVARKWKRERDELLAALKTLTENIGNVGAHDCPGFDCNRCQAPDVGWYAAHEAIARAESEPAPAAKDHLTPLERELMRALSASRQFILGGEKVTELAKDYAATLQFILERAEKMAESSGG